MSDLILDDFYGMQEINATSAKVNLSPLLEKQEELLWSSQPKQGLFWQAWEPAMIFNGLLWMSVPVVVLYKTVLQPFLLGKWPNGAFLLAVPILLLIFFLGYYTSIGQYLKQAKKRKKSFFGLTPTALLIATPEHQERIPLHKVLSPKATAKSKDFGHLEFKYPLHSLPNSQQVFAKGIHLKWVPHIKQLEDLLVKAKEENS